MAGFNVSVLEAIGNTPIVELNRYGAEVIPLSLVKLEFTNPGGSMKDRSALGMIEWAEGNEPSNRDSMNTLKSIQKQLKIPGES